jgi:SAM-dependent methyltransferase
MATPTTTPTTTPTADQPIVLDLGSNTLYPGKDGILPVKVRWVHQLAAPENFYVVDDVIYVSDECLITLSLFSGEELWRACKPDGNGFFSDGGDEIGPAGPGRIRVWMWFNDNLLIDLKTHSVIRRGPGLGHRPPGFKPFPALRDHTYNLKVGRRLKAYDRSGRLAWSIATTFPLIYPLGPVTTPSGAIIVTGSGLMVSLDYPR